MPAAEIRLACRKYAQKYVELQKRDFQRLGIFGRWHDPYLTMSAQYQSVIAGAYVDFLDQGYIYKGLKPVNWCIVDRTALAEAEVEYADHNSPSIWVRFALASDPAKIHTALAGRKVYGLIWTTTPWTIPANMAIAFHPKFEYVAVDVAGDVYIVAQDLLAATAEKSGWRDYQIVARFAGAAVEQAVFRHPFLDRDSLGILAEHVTLEQGTGAVHTAPGHGMEDYVVARQYGIATYCPVDAAGRFYHAEGAEGRLPEELIGLNVWKANPVVIDILRSAGALLAEEKVQHSYPHCWRCHNPTIFRATEQWFIGMDRNDLRQRALDAIRKVKWLPAWGEERISNMIATRPDWCISRQRVWGVPIAVFLCEGCGKPLNDPALNRKVIDFFGRFGADAWYTSEAEALAAGAKCGKCGGTKFSKETDIIDVWFESGSSHVAVLGHEPNLPWPADIYLEGADQYRGWFHSSLLCAIGAQGRPPYRMIATHGWTLDEHGSAMSKSRGNDVDPVDVADRLGGEIVRLWAASVDFREDVVGSEKVMQQVAENYRTIRNNLFRYVLSNLYDFDSQKDVWLCRPKWSPLVATVLLNRSPTEKDILAYARFPGRDPRHKAIWETLLAIAEQVKKALDTAPNEKLTGRSVEAKPHVPAAD